MNKISVIILNLNDSQTTINCLKSILKYTKNISFEIVVVDNGSHISEKLKLKNSLVTKNKNIKLVFSDRNLGFGGGNNLGIKESIGNYLFILNNDTLFFENSLKKLLKEYQKLSHNHKVGLLQPRLFNDVKKTKVQQTSTQIPNTFQILQENFSFLKKFRATAFSNFRLLDWDRNSEKLVECVCGAAFFCSRLDFEKIGLFDPRFKIYFEEYDLGRRTKKLKYQNFYTTQTSIIHLQSLWPAPYWYKKLIYTMSFLRYFLKYLKT